MITRPPIPHATDGPSSSAEPSVEAVSAEARSIHDRPIDEQDRADEAERARMERTARYLKGPTAFSA